MPRLLVALYRREGKRGMREGGKDFPVVYSTRSLVQLTFLCSRCGGFVQKGFRGLSILKVHRTYRTMTILMGHAGRRGERDRERDGY